jgi:hypothetical protein
VPEHRDGHPDELVPEAAPLGPHQADEHRPVPCAWDAWDGAHPDATAEADLRPAPSGAGAEKLAVLAPGDPARDASSLQLRPQVRLLVQPAQPDEAAELCTPDAVRSAERSCAALEAAGSQLQAVQPGAAGRAEPAAQPMRSPKALPTQPQRAESRDAAVPLLAAELESRLEALRPPASPQRERSLRAAQLAEAPKLPAQKSWARRAAAWVGPPAAQPPVSPPLPEERLGAHSEAPLLLSVA